MPGIRSIRRSASANNNFTPPKGSHHQNNKVIPTPSTPPSHPRRGIVDFGAPPATAMNRCFETTFHKISLMLTTSLISPLSIFSSVGPGRSYDRADQAGVSAYSSPAGTLLSTNRCPEFCALFTRLFRQLRGQRSRGMEFRKRPTSKTVRFSKPFLYRTRTLSQYGKTCSSRQVLVSIRCWRPHQDGEEPVFERSEALVDHDRQ